MALNVTPNSFLILELSALKGMFTLFLTSQHLARSVCAPAASTRIKQCSLGGGRRVRALPRRPMHAHSQSLLTCHRVRLLLLHSHALPNLPHPHHLWCDYLPMMPTWSSCARAGVCVRQIQMVCLNCVGSCRVVSDRVGSCWVVSGRVGSFWMV